MRNSMKHPNINDFSKENETYMISNKHLRLLDSIFRKHRQVCDLPKLQNQISEWAETVLVEKRRKWREMRVNSVEVLYHLDRKKEACKRANAKNKRYEPFKQIFKQLQKAQFEKYQKAGQILSANAFVKWFFNQKAQTTNIPYCQSNQKNQLTKLAQINNREFKKLLNAKADTSLTEED